MASNNLRINELFPLTLTCSFSNTKVESARTKWIAAVTQACLDYGICPALWDTGNDIKRDPAASYQMSNALAAAMRKILPSVK
jgi:hypothetical protein